MKELVLLSLKSIRKKLAYREYCFEIFGYDFILDEAAKPWLIEVNTNPCLEESSGLLKQFIPRMLDDAFSLTLDRLFPVKCRGRVFKVDGHGDDENMWEWILQIGVKNAMPPMPSHL